MLYRGDDIGALSSEAMRKLRSKLQIIFQDPYASLNPRWKVADVAGAVVAVDEDHAVLRVVDDVDDLLGEQADVQRVQDGAVGRHREVQLEVALVVPGERGNPLALLHAQAADELGKKGIVRADSSE